MKVVRLPELRMGHASRSDTLLVQQNPVHADFKQISIVLLGMCKLPFVNHD